MPIFLLFILVKVGLTLIGVTLVALLMAEFFPIAADAAVSSAGGTMMAPFAEWVSRGLLFCAKYANMFVDMVFGWLRAFGIDVSRGQVESELRNIDLEAPSSIDMPKGIEPPKNIEKPKF